jgi:hypothetical protein
MSYECTNIYVKAIKILNITTVYVFLKCQQYEVGDAQSVPKETGPL